MKHLIILCAPCGTGKFQMFIDNTEQTPEETAEIIAEYVKNL